MCAKYESTLCCGDPCKVSELELAGALVAGKISRESVSYCLLRLIGNRLMNESKGLHRYKTTASLPGMNQALMQEAGFTLAATCRNKRDLARHGYNPRAVPRVDLSPGNLPRFFDAVASTRTAEESAACAMNLLKIRNKRVGVMMFDETNFIPGVDVMYICLLPVGIPAYLCRGLGSVLGIWVQPGHAWPGPCIRAHGLDSHHPWPV